MNSSGLMQFLGPGIEVFIIDLLLSGDNALVIGLAIRNLPPRSRRVAILFGTWTAIVLRVLLTLVIGSLLAVPGLKLAGGLALTLIAIKLMVPEDESGGVDEESGDDAGAMPKGMVAAIGTIVAADFVMSLDNILALAAVAQDNAWVLILGLLLSIPLLMWGSMVISALLDRFRFLVVMGAALLGWIAGSIGLADVVISGWAQTQAPFLGVAGPWFMAGFVVLQGYLVKERSRKTRAERRNDESAA